MSKLSGTPFVHFSFLEVEWALIRGLALINFSCLQGGRLFEVGAYLRLGECLRTSRQKFVKIAGKVCKRRGKSF